jgi:hypothetical protein
LVFIHSGYLACRVKEQLQSMRLRAMEFDDPAPLPLSASPSSPNIPGGRFSPVASSHAGSSAAQDVPARASSDASVASGSYRSGLFEVSKGTFSSARVQPLLGSSQ